MGFVLRVFRFDGSCSPRSFSAATINGVNGWTLVASEAEGGAVLEVSGAEADAGEINGHGFIGVLALGMHHQAHQLWIARV